MQQRQFRRFKSWPPFYEELHTKALNHNIENIGKCGFLLLYYLISHLQTTGSTGKERVVHKTMAKKNAECREVQ